MPALASQARLCLSRSRTSSLWNLFEELTTWCRHTRSGEQPSTATRLPNTAPTASGFCRIVSAQLNKLG